MVEAMQYREREQLDLPIYCDSAVALSRVRKKKRRNSYDLSERPELMKEVDEKDRRLHAYN
ncbi:MAG: hypothetical protein LBG59_02230 [Candidatus Peribacteria bacterium]|nr:hypothetical protein [Candidatus Peribacteria bacterium]